MPHCSVILGRVMDRKKTGFQPLAFTLTVAAALLRLVPHPPNFSPVGGVALFGGAKLRGWQAYLVPLAAMLLTDPIRSWMEGGYPAYTSFTFVIYGCFLISVVLGRLLLRGDPGVGRIGSVALLGSVQFFSITNFARSGRIERPLPAHANRTNGMLHRWIAVFRIHRPRRSLLYGFAL